MAHEHPPSGTGRDTRVRLAIAVGVIAGYLVVQVIGALLSGSLALLADAGHMASDAIGLVVALVASLVAARPATDRHTFGFRRVEVLGALINGLLVAGVAILVTVEALRRLISSGPVEVIALPMLVVAAGGLLANIVAFLVLRGGDRDSIGLRGALLEVLGDMLGSVAVIVAAVVILLTGFGVADPIASLVIAAIMLPRAVLLLRDVVRVLTESAPPGTSVADIREHLLGTPEVLAVHDVHVWAITSGAPVFTAHVVVEPQVFEEGRSGELLERLADCLRGHFDVEHSTFQLEPAGHDESEPHAHD